MVVLRGCLPDGDDLPSWSGPRSAWTSWWSTGRCGFRVCGVEDAEKLADWLAVNVAHAERNPERVRQELLARCRELRVEPPAAARVTRMVRSALSMAEEAWFTRIEARCGPAICARILGLIAPEGDGPDGDQEEGEQVGDDAGEGAGSVLASVKTMPGNVSYGTNTGIKAVISSGHGHSEDDVRYVWRRYLTPATARMIAIAIADATFAARDPRLWGAGSTAVTSDSTHFRAWDQNLFTEWHSRYGGRGILVYWHVERGSVVVHSQTPGRLRIRGWGVGKTAVIRYTRLR